MTEEERKCLAYELVTQSSSWKMCLNYLSLVALLPLAPVLHRFLGLGARDVSGEVRDALGGSAQEATRGGAAVSRNFEASVSHAFKPVPLIGKLVALSRLQP